MPQVQHLRTFLCRSNRHWRHACSAEAFHGKDLIFQENAARTKLGIEFLHSSCQVGVVHLHLGHLRAVVPKGERDIDGFALDEARRRRPSHGHATRRPGAVAREEHQHAKGEGPERRSISPAIMTAFRPWAGALGLLLPHLRLFLESCD